MKEIIMPKMGFTMTESTIVEWLKKEGDSVEKGEPIAEVTTDKVNMEVEAPDTGTLAGFKYQAGDVVPVTEIIAYVLEPGETLRDADGQRGGRAEESLSSAPPPPSTPAPPLAPPLNATPVAIRMARERSIDLAQVKGSGVGGKITREDVMAALAPTPPRGDGRGEGVRATPNARRLASELSVDPATVDGSGPNGRVQGDDVKRVSELVSKRAREQTREITPPSSLTRSAASVPYGGMRKTIGTRLQQSYQQAPHVTFSIDVDVTGAEALRARANARLKEGQARVSLTAIIAKACAWALLRQPMMNARLDLDTDQITMNEAVHIGIAVALAEGLIVPVVRNVQTKGLMQIASDIADVSARAKANKLKADDLGGTFTISNLGMFGIDRFTAIINPPETAILAVGRANKTFVPDADDRPVLRPMLTLTLSADHRVIDGAVAAQFMSDLREAIEQPDSILL